MNAPADPVALLYDEDGYVETFTRPPQPGSERIGGPIGRQVAGKEFLDAYLTHGAWESLVAIVRNAGNQDSFVRYFKNHTSHDGKQRQLRVISERDFLQAFSPMPLRGLSTLPVLRTYVTPGLDNKPGRMPFLSPE